MDREMLKPFTDKITDLVETFGAEYVSEMYFEEDKNFKENGWYNIYANTDDGVIEIVSGLCYDEVDYELNVLVHNLMETKKRVMSQE